MSIVVNPDKYVSDIIKRVKETKDPVLARNL